MRLFNNQESDVYCTGYTNRSGDCEGSLRDFVSSRCLPGALPITLLQGTPEFDDYRSCAIRDAERSLFFAASHYRRFLDLTISSAAPWAYVTAYYGTWFAARAVLAIHGAGVFDKVVVEVARGSPGGQQLRILAIGKGANRIASTYTGSHRRFWDFFYKAARPMVSAVPLRLSPCLQPLGGDPTWQIRERNDINYDPYRAASLVADFGQTFVQSGFPSTLPGRLGSQFRVFEMMLELAFLRYRDIGISTDVFSNAPFVGRLRDSVKALVYSPQAPSLVRETIEKVVT